MTDLFRRSDRDRFCDVVRHRGGSPANRLVAVAIIGQLIAYALAILVARQLSASGFEAYVVASALFILGATLAPLGSEKLTLRLWPGLAARADWPHARGLLRFGARRTTATALATATIVGVGAAVATEGEMRAAILVTALSLPAGALVHHGVDLLTAAGRPFRALAIFRIAVPGLALSLVAIAVARDAPIGAAFAVGAWGLGWLVALAVMAAALRPLLAPAFAGVTAQRDPGWGRAARPFLVHRLAQSLLAQSGVLALELAGGADAGADVGAYAAAMATATLAAVLATATNRAYGAELSLLLETGDAAAIAAFHRRRRAWLLLPLGGFLVVALGFPGVLLGLFRPEFVAAGTPALRILALTTAVTVTFALAPTQLKFEGRRNELYAILAAAALLQIALLALLVPPLAATGAAIAHALAMGGSYAVFALRTRFTPSGRRW
jgi:O-antigen/teichoic acid export membrane protein